MMRLRILTPIYDHWKQLIWCLDGVRSTSTADWRVAVIDNNSEDDTKAVAESFTARKRSPPL